MKKILRYILITLFCCVIFFLLGEPCRYFLKLSETTEVRPVATFPLLFGIAYGFFGTFRCALGNMLADIWLAANRVRYNFVWTWILEYFL